MEVIVENLAGTRRLAECLADSIGEGIIITLSGNLGAGKTTFVQAFGKQLGIPEVITSPTFTMMNEYETGRLPLFHLDFYRAGEQMDKNKKTGQEKDISLNYFVYEFEEILDKSPLVIIEWPEYFIVDGDNYLKGLDRLEININPVTEKNSSESRSLQLLAIGQTPEQVLNSLNSSLAKMSEMKILN